MIRKVILSGCAAAAGVISCGTAMTFHTSFDQALGIGSMVFSILIFYAMVHIE